MKFEKPSIVNFLRTPNTEGPEQIVKKTGRRKGRMARRKARATTRQAANSLTLQEAKIMMRNIKHGGKFPTSR